MPHHPPQDLSVFPVRKAWTVERLAGNHVSIPRLQREILLGRHVAGDFVTMLAPLAPRDQTLFKAWTTRTRLIVGVAALDAIPTIAESDYGRSFGALELHFNPANDGLGRMQFVFDAAGKPEYFSFLPYPEVYDSRHRDLCLDRHEVMDQILPSRLRVRWIFAWLDLRRVFPDGVSCGFNVCRHRTLLREHSAWNDPAGHGFADPTGYGTLWLKAPGTQLDTPLIRRDGAALRFSLGRRAGTGSPPMLLVDPLGVRHPSGLCWRGATAEGTFTSKGELVPGRWRLEPVRPAAVEPCGFWFDVPRPERPRRPPLTLAVTYDPPMNMRSNSYTPARVAAEMRLWAGWGVSRINWIEQGLAPGALALSGYRRASERACGGTLRCAVTEAHKAGMSLHAVFKPFDVVFHWLLTTPPGRTIDRATQIVHPLENRVHTAARDIVRAHDAVFQTNAAWLADRVRPVRTLRFYSEAPLPALKARDVTLYVSHDNARFRPYTGAVTVRVQAVKRPHARWTPAGKRPAAGSVRNWCLELTGLTVRADYLAVALPETVTLTHKPFMLVEADGDTGACPVYPASEGRLDGGFMFWTRWPSWNNRTELLVERRSWCGLIGLALKDETHVPELLEPTYPAVQELWLARIRRMLTAGVDAVDIRTLCHHNGVMSYLRLAFAPVVRDTFASLYGRAPRPEPDDYERIRRIRGEAYTAFLRAVRRQTAAAGAKLCVHIENGMEVPPHLDTRMQIAWDWRGWISEGIVDEVTLKWFSERSRFVHEHVLPVCRRHGVPVHVCSRNLDGGLTERGVEVIESVLERCAAAGLAGYNLYETANLTCLNPAGATWPQHNTAAVMVHARAVLERINGG